MTASKHTWVRIEDVGELEVGNYTVMTTCDCEPVTSYWDGRLWLNDLGVDCAETHILSPHLGPIPECDG